MRGDANILIEQFIEGEEVSFTIISDGITFLTLPTSRDHKKLLNNNKGPNTGGMGAYSPAIGVSKQMINEIENKIVIPTLNGIKQEGFLFKGFLYIGVIYNKKNGIYVLEYNVRLGDPEALSIIFRLDSDLLSLIEHAINETLSEYVMQLKEEYCSAIYLSTPEYPYKKISKKVDIKPYLF